MFFSSFASWGFKTDLYTAHLILPIVTDHHYIWIIIILTVCEGP